MCIRDDQGQFIPTKTGWILPILEVDIGEALGLLSALNWVNKLRLEDVDFKLDSRTIVMRFHNKREDISEFGDVIRDFLCTTNILETRVLNLLRNKPIRSLTL
jgi:hypothetical protein